MRVHDIAMIVCSPAVYTSNWSCLLSSELTWFPPCQALCCDLSPRQISLYNARSSPSQSSIYRVIRLYYVSRGRRLIQWSAARSMWMTTATTTTSLLEQTQLFIDGIDLLLLLRALANRFTSLRRINPWRRASAIVLGLLLLLLLFLHQQEFLPVFAHFTCETLDWRAPAFASACAGRLHGWRSRR